MAASGSLPEPPVQLKAIHSFMRIAQDIERVDPVVAYWVRLYSTESALKIDRESPECKTFLGAIILWLEKFKQTHKDNEAVSNQTVGQAHMENFVVALFNKADTIDRDGKADKNTVRMFYMAAVLFEAMAVFGQVTEEVSKKAKYAKFKAAYIQKCLKSGIVPKPGPVESTDLEGEPQAGSDGSAANTMPQPSVNQAGGSSGNASSGVLDIPEVPTTNDKEISSRPKQDPFILTPSSPPQPPKHPSLPPGCSTTSSPAVSVKYPDPLAGGTPSGKAISAQVSTINTTRFHATNGTPLNPEDIIKGQKYCKFANSALQYDDIPTAVANLEKALKLLTTGQNPDQ